MSELRLFIAIELNDPLRNHLKQLQQQLQDDGIGRNVRWVAPQNIHFTLKFLGNVGDTRLPALTAAIERAAQTIPPLTLQARGLGCFPNTRRPNNIWVGLDGDVATTTLLVRRIEDECAIVGLPRDDRAFTPHLTLGRIKREASPTDKAAVGAAVERATIASSQPLRVHTIHLIASELRPGGPVYKTVARIKLKQ